MKVTSVSLSDLEYRLVRWYAGKKGENVSRMAARLILAEADLYAHENGCQDEWAVLFEDQKPPEFVVKNDSDVVV